MMKMLKYTTNLNLVIIPFARIIEKGHWWIPVRYHSQHTAS